MRQIPGKNKARGGGGEMMPKIGNFYSRLGREIRPPRDVADCPQFPPNCREVLGSPPVSEKWTISIDNREEEWAESRGKIMPAEGGLK